MARVRTFIAVDVPTPIRARCLELQEELAQACDLIKWVEESSLHVTLLFLGEVEDRDLNNVCKAVAGACASKRSFRLAIDGIGTFGAMQQPRTIWAGIAEGADELRALHTALEAPLLKLGCYRREDRPYSPHLTLGRVKTNRPSDNLAQAILRRVDWHGGEYDVREIHVMSSELTREGPIYTVLSRANLG